MEVEQIKKYNNADSSFKNLEIEEFSDECLRVSISNGKKKYLFEFYDIDVINDARNVSKDCLREALIKKVNTENLEPAFEIINNKIKWKKKS